MWCIVTDEIQANVLNLVTDFLTLFCEMDKTFTAEGKHGISIQIWLVFFDLISKIGGLVSF